MPSSRTSNPSPSWRLFRADGARVSLPPTLGDQSLRVLAIAPGFLQLRCADMGEGSDLRVGCGARATVRAAGLARWFRPAPGALLLTVAVEAGGHQLVTVCDLAGLVAQAAAPENATASLTPSRWPMRLCRCTRRGLLVPESASGAALQVTSIELGRLELTSVEPQRRGASSVVRTRGRLWLPPAMVSAVTGPAPRDAVITACAPSGTDALRVLALGLERTLVPLAARLAPPEGAYLTAAWPTPRLPDVDPAAGISSSPPEEVRPAA